VFCVVVPLLSKFFLVWMFNVEVVG